MNFMTKFEFIRERNGISQKELAKILNINESTYSNYKNGLDIIPLKHLNTLCNYFNKSIDYIFGFNELDNYKNHTKDINSITIGKRLKEFRHDNKLTQVALANFLKTTHSTLSAYESGKTLILTSFLYDICKKYKISADYLLGKIDSPKYLN